MVAQDEVVEHHEVVVVHAVDHRVGAEDAVAGCDIANVSIRGLPLFVYTATFVIVEVIARIVVSGGMDVDDRLPYRCYEE